MENQYSNRHAREILEPCGLLGDYLEIKKRGVRPAFEVNKLVKAETNGLRWRPARQLKDLPGAPEVKGTPMLPNPFNARELAAFMLEGIGASVRCEYGEWADGPSEQSLDRIDLDSNARRAVIEAFAAYRLAIEKVGKWDADALARRDAAYTAFWESSNDTVLLKAFEDAEAEWHAAHQAWLTAMVVCLLVEQKPQAANEAPAVARDKTVRPVQRSTAQDAAIMSAIREAGCDPLKLPKPPQGKSGIKAVVRAALVGKNPLFPIGGTQFTKAWDRLRIGGEIADLL